MYKSHKLALFALFFICMGLFYFLNITITESITQNLVIFLSIVFGFYMTSASVLYGSNFSKKLYNEVDEKIKGKTKLYILKRYFINSSCFLLLSILSLITFSLFAEKDAASGLLTLETVKSIDLWILSLNLNKIFISALVSGCFVNILFLWLILKLYLIALTQEAKS